MPRLVLDIYHGERGIDLAAWKSRHDVWGVIVKCGGSDDNHWNRYEETTWVEQVTQAHALGLHVGAFYYSDALTASDALADAKHCIHECLRGMTIDLPIYLDIEEPSQLNLPMWQLTEVVTTFCDYVQSQGYQAGIYSGYYGFRNMSESKIAGYSLWVAAWRTSWPIWASDYDLWQEGSMKLDGSRYHEDGEVDGAGKVDLDWASDAFVARIENGGGKVPTTRTGWAQTLETCQDPADYAYCTCKVYSCGYSQPKRDHISVEYLRAGTAETDCSAGVSWWLWKGGYLDECPWFHTKIEREYLQEHGYDLIDANAGFVKMQRNDVLWRPGHTALYIGEGMQAEALRTERHDAGYDGSTPGDQDQGETVVRKLTLDWDYILRKRNPPTYETDTKTDTEVTPMGKLVMYYSDADKRNMLWDGCFDHVPYHLNVAEKQAVETLYGVKLQKIPNEQAQAILDGCMARKAWNKEYDAQALRDAVTDAIFEGLR